MTKRAGEEQFFKKIYTEETQAVVIRTKRTVSDITKTLVLDMVPVDLVQNL